MRFDAEKIRNHEIGLKSDWLGGRLRTNVAAFLMKYQDQQVAGVQLLEPVSNVGSSKIRGLELEAQALLTERLNVDLVVSVLDAKYEHFVRPSGEDLSSRSRPRISDGSSRCLAAT